MKVYFNNHEYDIQGEVTDLLSKIISNNPDVLTGLQIVSPQDISGLVETIIGDANSLLYKGGIDCSGNPPFPAADAGWLYITTVAGKIGGGSGIDVEVGDLIICNTDGTVSGTNQTYWNVIEKNIIGAVVGPNSSVNLNIPIFSGTTGKVISDSGQSIQDVLNSASGVSQSIANIAESNANDYTDLAVDNFASSTSGLTDMNINNIVSGETVVFNGTDFIPTAFPSGGGNKNIVVTIPGNAVVTNRLSSFVSPCNGNITNLDGIVDISPSGSALLYRFNKNGNAITSGNHIYFIPNNSVSVTFDHTLDTVSCGTEIFDLARIRFSSTGTLPPELTAGTDYWIIFINGAYTFKVASSYANAVADIAISLSGNGSGTATLYMYNSGGSLDTSSVLKNDIITIDATQVGSTIAGGNNTYFNIEITPT
jgi:hypothetical protein